MRRMMLFSKAIVMASVIVFSHSAVGQVTWQRSPSNPLLSHVPGFNAISDPRVLYDSSRLLYHMWFAGFNWTYGSVFSIYHATSTNKVTWNISPSGPVMVPGGPGSVDVGGERGPDVIYDGTEYKMYYMGLTSLGFSFCLATSPDGIAWTKYAGNPVLTVGSSGSWDSQSIAFPCAYFDGITYFLWYGGSPDGVFAGTGLATSSDGKHWSKYSGNPVISHSTSGWDSLGDAQPIVTVANGVFYMMFVGGKTAQCCFSSLGLATSGDGIRWTKYPRNPVFEPSQPGTWDGQAITTGTLLFSDSIFHLWYTAYSPSTGVWQTGYASSSPSPIVFSGFLANILIHDAGENQVTLEFGTNPAATDGLDTLLGETELPPTPPSGDFDARWVIQGTLGSLEDFRDTLGGEHTQNVYVCAVQPGPASYPITLQWDPSAFPEGTFVLQDQVTHGGLYSVNMRNQNSFSISDSTRGPLEIVTTNMPSIVSGVFRGWNMISLPVTVPDRSLHSLFPSAYSHAFRYDGRYETADSLDYGVGYWAKFDTVRSVSISGNAFASETVSVVRGWNMIGSLSSSVNTSDVVQNPSANVLSRYYSYQGGYKTFTAIEPMRGYWVKVSCDGQLVLGSSVSKSGGQTISADGNLAGLNRLDVADAAGHSMALYFTPQKDIARGFDSAKYVVPPLPPQGLFDVRFGTEQQLALYPSGGVQQYEINVQASAYPLNISWNIPEGSDASYSLLAANSGKEIAADMAGKGSVQLAGSDVKRLYLLVNPGEGNGRKPKEFALNQNYPNPFNPTTLISYALPTDALVTLKVYNVLGQEISTLIDERQASGYHAVQWDASGMPSGVYVYRMTAGASSFVRKLVLLK